MAVLELLAHQCECLAYFPRLEFHDQAQQWMRIRLLAAAPRTLVDAGIQNGGYDSSKPIAVTDEPQEKSVLF